MNTAEPNAQSRSSRLGHPRDQPLALGLFSTNINGSTIMTTAPTSFELSWEHSKLIATMADRMGLDFLVSVARWSGFDGPSRFAQEAFETLTYIAGLAAVTNRILVFSTVHVPIVHPLIAAKAMATIDHISGGRGGLNIVMGWNERDMGMFGIPLRAHDERYRYGAEWIEVFERICASDEPFNFEGEFFHLTQCQSAPRPIQQHVPIINAGMSDTGIDFSARYADFNFTSLESLDHVRRYVKNLTELSGRYDREVRLMTIVLVVCRETEEEAWAAYREIERNADLEGGEHFARAHGAPVDKMTEDQRMAMIMKLCVRPADARIIGTPQQVAERLQDIKAAGIDGVLLGFLDYAEELPFFEQNVMPLLREMGLRS